MTLEEMKQMSEMEFLARIDIAFLKAFSSCGMWPKAIKVSKETYEKLYFVDAVMNQTRAGFNGATMTAFLHPPRLQMYGNQDFNDMCEIYIVEMDPGKIEFEF